MAIQEQLSVCSALRTGNEDLWEKAISHRFLQEVEQDALPDEKLRFYFVQNVHYIDAAIRFTAEAAAKAPIDAARNFCLWTCQFGREEIERQRDYVRQLAGGAEVDWEIAPTCYAYTSHLMRLAAYGGTLDLLVGLLPCSWTYDEFATRLKGVVSHPVTTAWFDSFGGDEHNDLEREYLRVVDDLGRDAPPERLAQLQEIFRMGCRYEWMFWEMSYTFERWPI